MPSPADFARYARGTAIAFEFTGTILGSSLVGWWLDQRFEADGAIAVVVILIGVVSGFVRLLQMLKQFQKIDRERER